MPIPGGIGNAIVTPFGANDKIDHGALTTLAQWQIAEGIDFLVACGSTGEAQTLSPEERRAVVLTVLEAVDGKVPVLAGATDNDTRRAVKEAVELSRLGVAGIMSAAPFYNKPTQAGLIAHFTAIADAVDVPLLLYNVPGRTAVDIKPETVQQLAEHPRIEGIKEASASIRRILDLVACTPTDFSVLCGDDDLAAPAIASGARGLISVAGNIIPALMSSLVHTALAGRFAEAAQMQRDFLPLIDALFVEANPIPVKAILAHRGRCADLVRLPLLPATPSLRARLSQLLQEIEVTHG